MHPAAVRHGGGLLHVAQHGRQLCSSRGEQRRRSAAGTGRWRPGPATAASPTQGCPAFRECRAVIDCLWEVAPGRKTLAELTVLESGVGARCCRSAEPLTACTQHRQHAGGQADTGQSSCRRRRLRASVDSEGAGAIGWARKFRVQQQPARNGLVHSVGARSGPTCSVHSQLMEAGTTAVPRAVCCPNSDSRTGRREARGTQLPAP